MARYLAAETQILSRKANEINVTCLIFDFGIDPHESEHLFLRNLPTHYLSRSLSPSELAEKAYGLYEKPRPDPIWKERMECFGKLELDRIKWSLKKEWPLPWLRRIFASLSFPMICSAVYPLLLHPCLFIFISSPILTHPLDRFSGDRSNVVLWNFVKY